ncbi:MAG: Bug family tripartite tricarboxylate transporter substrate binding protein [Acidovorax sp.]
MPVAMPRSRFLSCLVAAAALLAAPAGAWAQQGYPDRPIKLIVPFAPGGATDILGRLLATALGERLGQPMVVENRAGAGTVVGASIVAKAPADGYTLLLGANTTFTLNPAIRSNLPYDPVRSFTPLGLVADMGLLLVAHNDTPGSTLKEVIAQTKAAPEKFSYGSYGTGSSVHFGGEVLKSTTGAKMLHVPFNGSAPNLTALMGGQVQFAVDTVVASTPLIKAGKIKPIVALGAQRLALLPNLPTVAESGYAGFDMGSWFAFVGPAGLPAPVQAKLEKALADTMASAEFRKKLVDIGMTPAWSNGGGLRARIERELPAMRAVAARADIRGD